MNVETNKQKYNKRQQFCFSFNDQEVVKLIISNYLMKDHPDLSDWFLYKESGQTEAQKEIRYFFGFRFNKGKLITHIIDYFAKFKMINEPYPSKAKIDILKKDNQLESHIIQKRVTKDKSKKDLKNKINQQLNQNKSLTNDLEKKEQQKHELKAEVYALKKENQLNDLKIESLKNNINRLFIQKKKIIQELQRKDKQEDELKEKIDTLEKDTQSMNLEIETFKIQRDSITEITNQNNELIKKLEDKETENQNLYNLIQYNEIKTYQEVEAIYRKQSKVYSNDFYVELEWGILLIEQKRYREAKEIYLNCARLLIEQKRYGDAKKIYLELTKLFIRLKRYEEAEEIYLEWARDLSKRKKYEEVAQIYSNCSKLKYKQDRFVGAGHQNSPTESSISLGLESH